MVFKSDLRIFFVISISQFYQYYYYSYLKSKKNKIKTIQNGGSTQWQVQVTQPHNIEVPRSLVEVVVSWNIPMHAWLKKYVFKPTRKTLGKTKQKSFASQVYFLYLLIYYSLFWKNQILCKKYERGKNACKPIFIIFPVLGTRSIYRVTLYSQRMRLQLRQLNFFRLLILYFLLVSLQL